MQHTTFDANRLRIALAAANKTKLDVSHELQLAYSTCAGYLNGRSPAPEGFREQVEDVLGLKPGTLRPKRKKAVTAA